MHFYFSLHIYLFLNLKKYQKYHIWLKPSCLFLENMFQSFRKTSNTGKLFNRFLLCILQQIKIKMHFIGKKRIDLLSFFQPAEIVFSVTYVNKYISRSHYIITHLYMQTINFISQGMIFNWKEFTFVFVDWLMVTPGNQWFDNC